MSDFRAPSAIHMQGHVGTVEFGADDKLIVWFFRRPELLGKASEEAGRPIYASADYVHIQQPGERDYVERTATEYDRRRFARHWAAYQEGREADESGTPLAVLFPTEPEQVEMMRALKIRTIEQLAGLTEQGISRLGMGARAQVQKAQRFLEDSKAAAPFHALSTENAELREQIAQLREQVAALAAERGEAKHKRTRADA